MSNKYVSLLQIACKLYSIFANKTTEIIGKQIVQISAIKFPTASGRQHRRCIIPQTVTHSLVLLKMGKIISRNMLS